MLYDAILLVNHTTYYMHNIITVLEITVGHQPFSDQFQYLTSQNSFCSDKFTVRTFSMGSH